MDFLDVVIINHRLYSFCFSYSYQHSTACKKPCRIVTVWRKV